MHNAATEIKYIGSRPSDHYFRSVCWFVCLSVCAELFSAVFDPICVGLRRPYITTLRKCYSDCHRINSRSHNIRIIWKKNSYSRTHLFAVPFVRTCLGVRSFSVAQLLKSGTLSLQLFECIPAQTLSVATSRLNYFQHPLSAFLLVHQIQLLPTTVYARL